MIWCASPLHKLAQLPSSRRFLSSFSRPSPFNATLLNTHNCGIRHCRANKVKLSTNVHNFSGPPHTETTLLRPPPPAFPTFQIAITYNKITNRPTRITQSIVPLLGPKKNGKYVEISTERKASRVRKTSKNYFPLNKRCGIIITASVHLYYNNA